MDLLDGKIGQQGGYSVELKEGKLVADIGYSPLAGMSAKVAVEIGADAALDAIERAIPGDWDKAPIAALKALLQKLSEEQKAA